MGHQSETFYLLCNKYFTGQLSESEKEELNSLLVHEHYKREWHALELAHRNPSVQNTQNQFPQEQYNRTRKRALFLTWKLRLSAAASVAAIIGLVFLAQFLFQPEPTSAPQYVYEIVTQPGQRSTSTLPDGTSVTLAGGASLKLLKGYNESERRVKLTGRVFLEVAKDSSKPFIVDAGSLECTVLGTSFLCDSDSIESTVSLLTGKLQVVYDSKETVVLVPGKRVTANQSTGMETSLFNVQEAEYFQQKILAFKNKNIREVCREISFWYGVEVVFDESSSYDSCTVTARFNNPTLNEVMQTLKRSHHIEYNIENNRLHIHAANCQ